MGVAHGDPSFAEVGPKNSNFLEVSAKFFQNSKKIKLGVVLGQNLGQVLSKQEAMVVKPLEWKCIAITARNIKFQGC